MTIPLVVGIDGSEASLEAVDWAADEAVRHEVPLHLVHAAPLHHEAPSLIAAASERASRSAPAVRLSSEVLHGDAASALVDKGRNAFALVLGCRGLGDLAGLLLGSVSLAVAARADCPVVVVRGGVEYRNARFGSVVVGVENGEGSGTAVQFAFREAHVRRCRLVAVHAWSAPFEHSEPPPLSGYALEAHRRPLAQVLDDALRGPAERYGHIAVSRQAVEGPARRALLEGPGQALTCSSSELAGEVGMSVSSWGLSTTRCCITRRVRSRWFHRYDCHGPGDQHRRGSPWGPRGRPPGTLGPVTGNCRRLIVGGTDQQ